MRLTRYRNSMTVIIPSVISYNGNLLLKTSDFFFYFTAEKIYFYWDTLTCGMVSKSNSYFHRPTPEPPDNPGKPKFSGLLGFSYYDRHRNRH